MAGYNSYNNIFQDYYTKNKGVYFKSFEININDLHSSYDIYWGDPEIIFDKKSLQKTFPLAVTVIPHGNNILNPRIFLHEKLERKYIEAFEIIIAHEIGHLWLYDVVGINHPMTDHFMKNFEVEIWADYFAYSFFVKYRNIDSLEKFNSILEEASCLQMQIYNLDPRQHIKKIYINKSNNLSILDDKVKMELESNNRFMVRMTGSMETTLNSLGDIFT